MNKDFINFMLLIKSIFFGCMWFFRCIFASSNKDKQTIFINNQKLNIMKQTVKNSSKNTNNTNNTVNSEVLSPETIKVQLKAACVNMNAAQTKEYIKGLDGYELKLTGQKPTQHYTVFYGEVRICNVEQVQGIKADGTARGCSSTKAIKTLHCVLESHMNFLREKFINELTKEEQTAAEEQFLTLVDNCDKIDTIFEAANKRAAEAAEAAAKAKREAAAKERAQNKMNNKLKKSSDNEKIAALAAVLDITFDEAKIIFEKKRAQKTA